MLTLLRHSDPWERPALLIALGRIGAPEGASALVRAADDPSRWVRVCALHALAEMRAPGGADVARTKLSDPSWSVRGAASLALGKLGNPEDEARLLPLLRDAHAWVRRGAVYGLGEIGARGALPRLRNALNDVDSEVRLAATWVLGHLTDRVALSRLVKLLETTPRGPPEAGRTLSLGDGAVRLVSDADSRQFDALVQAVGVFAASDSRARKAITRARRTVPEEQLDTQARLPTPLGRGMGTATLRQLFDGAGFRHASPSRKRRGSRSRPR